MVFALTYVETLEIAEEVGWTATASWREGGKYANTRPGVRLRTLLEPYRMEACDWRAKIAGSTMPASCS
jgi:hypothetical protein